VNDYVAMPVPIYFQLYTMVFLLSGIFIKQVV